MAKKNSTKTATKEALQASEPKLQAFRQWKGINFSEVSPKWNNYTGETITDDTQTDLSPNYLLVQNNLKTTAQAAIQTAYAPIQWIEGPDIHGATYSDMPQNWPNAKSMTISGFSGVSLIDHEYGYFVANAIDPENDNASLGDGIFVLPRTAIDPTLGGSPSAVDYPLFQTFETDDVICVPNQKVTDLHVYLNRLIAMVEKTETDHGVEVKSGGIYATGVSDDRHIFVTQPLLSGYELNPQSKAEDAPTITCFGEVEAVTPETESEEDNELWSAQCSFFYSLTNQWGATQPSTYMVAGSDDYPGEGSTLIYFNIAPSEWTNQNYIQISGTINEENTSASYIDGISWKNIGVDIYMIMNESTYPIFVGHAEAAPPAENSSTRQWFYNFYGAMTDLAEWNQGSLMVPSDNTTGGVPCRYVTQIDGRMYFWGDPQNPYRLYIGGNTGHELSIARGHGGAYCDIEPGSGCEIKMVEKFKTYGGSSIVTILCSNVNGTKQHRYNLIETNIVTTSELSTQAYMVEEIANVVGTTSRHGGGAWSDGLYYINRNGLMVTTQQMEYNSQLRSVLVSDPISPVFEEQKGSGIANAYVVCIKDIIYMAICADADSYSGINGNVSKYNSFIWCYDIGLKAWYTLQPRVTIPKLLGDTSRDSTLSSRDATLLSRYLNGLISEDQLDLEVADVNADGAINQNDVKAITEHIVNGDTTYPIGQSAQVALIPKGLFVYDHEDSVYYGLGVVDSMKGVYVLPMLDNQENNSRTSDNPQYITFITPELGTSNPNTQWQWLCQLELNFDWFEGEAEIEVNGVDYYGRRMHIVKKIDTGEYVRTSVVNPSKPVMMTAFNVPIRIDTLVRYYHITLKGKCSFRLNNIIARTYTQSKKMGLYAGYDAQHSYLNRFNAEKNYMHDAVSIYNNLEKLAYEYHEDELDRETANVT